MAAVVAVSLEGSERIEPAAAQDLVALFDRDRVDRGLPPLRRVQSLRRAASTYAAAMVESPDGSDPDRVGATGRLAGWCVWQVGEVLAWGAPGPDSPPAVMRAWLESPRHRRLIGTRGYREVGFGVARGTPFGVDGATYAVLLGGRGRK